MTNRTVQFWGQGYSLPPAEGLALTPCTITATVAGNVVFSGTIPTIESSDINRVPSDQQILFTCEIPLVTGNTLYTIPVSLDITGDDVFLEQIEANYCNNGNISTGPSGFYSITTGYVGNIDARSNVVVTNAAFVSPGAPDPLQPGDPTGTWGREVEPTPGQTCTFAFDMNVFPGLE